MKNISYRLLKHVSLISMMKRERYTFSICAWFTKWIFTIFSLLSLCVSLWISLEDDSKKDISKILTEISLLHSIYYLYNPMRYSSSCKVNQFSQLDTFFSFSRFFFVLVLFLSLTWKNIMKGYRRYFNENLLFRFWILKRKMRIFHPLSAWKWIFQIFLHFWILFRTFEQ